MSGSPVGCITPPRKEIDRGLEKGLKMKKIKEVETAAKARGKRRWPDDGTGEPPVVKRRDVGPWPRRPLVSLAALFAVLSLFGSVAVAAADSSAPPKEKICVGNININHKTDMATIKSFENCTVLEGSFQINSALLDYQKAEDHLNFSFPHLREITDYVLLYRANQIKDLSTLLPKLAVIRGHKLIQNYALAIYQMKNMETVGLHSLTHILKGGVRIEKNPSLCYVETINWRRIVVDPIHKEHHVVIEENREAQTCLDTCLPACDNGNCWDSDHCQINLVKCPSGTGADGLEQCYTGPRGDPGTPCSTECLGGCTGPLPTQCTACANMRWTGEGCKEKCPGLPWLSYLNWTCISTEECSSLGSDWEGEGPGAGRFKIHRLPGDMGQCVPECPADYQAAKNEKGIWVCERCDNCPRYCDGGTVNSREAAERFRHCTHIRKNLEIRVSEGDITPILEDTMKDIKVISGMLKVSRSFALVSLYFLKSLERIEGNLDHGEDFSLTVLENENLQKLFPDSARVKIRGRAFIHYNQKLCMEEIRELIAASGMQQPENFEVSEVTNGNKAVCSKEKLRLAVKVISGTMIMMSIENYRQSLFRSNQDVSALIGYEIYYREIGEDQLASRNVSKFEGLDACGGNTWTIMDKRPDDAQKPRLTACTANSPGCIFLNGEYRTWVYPDEMELVGDLKPFTPYALYVTTLMVPHLASNATGAQSDILYIRTLEEPPEPVRNLQWRGESSSSLKIMWKPPRHPHGIIDHYDVMLDYLPFVEMARRRNYCQKKIADVDQPPNAVGGGGKDVSESNKTPPGNETIKGGGGGACQTCTCAVPEQDPTKTGKIEDSADEHVEEQDFHNDIINKIFTISVDAAGSPLSVARRRRRSISELAAGELNRLKSEESKADDELPYSIVYTKLKGATDKVSEKIYNETSYVNGTETYSTLYIRVNGNETDVVVHRLKHFAIYHVKVMACQAERRKDPNCTHAHCILEKDCSPWSLEEAKTLPKLAADDILRSGEKLTVVTANETTGETSIRWRPPADPNEMIVNYMLRMATSLADETDKTYPEMCISLGDLEELDEGWVEYRLERPGEYWISLRAVSLHSGGAWTTWQWVKVNTTSTHTTLLIVLVLLALALLGVGGVAFAVHQKKKSFAEITWDYVSRNPEYMDTADVYNVDDWEVSRDLIEKGELLGSGSFGICHRGIYHHPEKGDIPVAVKTVPEDAKLHQRIEFLNEASVMKEINTTHVVKLLGVVSQGQPTLVLMELMENGDLRKYLRSLRPDSENNLGRSPPQLKEILQMALEIADGMAYLSVKKYIHRDLAARNCMVSANNVVKVGDLGMAQDVYEREYYKTEGRRLLPVRWMAPESLRDGKFTTKSDVWGFGVVLWEMATLAEQPYQGWSNDEVVRLVKDGNVMLRPENCPDILYDMMKDCWQRSPEQRPSFLDLCERLLPQATELFLQNAFYTSSQGSEAVATQTALRQAQEEADLATPLTTNGTGSDNNGHVDSRERESHPLRDLLYSSANKSGRRAQQQPYPTFKETGYPRPPSAGNSSSNGPKLTMNGLGVIQRLRNKSGSTSGEA